jgi:hypothetical protein
MKILKGFEGSWIKKERDGKDIGRERRRLEDEQLQPNPVIGHWLEPQYTEPVFVNLSRSPGIEYQPGGPVPQPCLSYRPARLHRLAELIPRIRFLGSLNVHKYGLCTVRPGNGTNKAEWSQQHSRGGGGRGVVNIKMINSSKKCWRSICHR